MALYARARRDCSDLLTAFELILRGGIEIAHARPARTSPIRCRRPIPAYVLIEAACRRAGRPARACCEDFLGGADDLVEDGVVASSRAQAERLWLYREIMVETAGPRRPLSAHRRLGADLEARRFRRRRAGGAGEGRCPRRWPSPTAMSATATSISTSCRRKAWTPTAIERLFEEAEALIFAVVDRYGGSISAEHGIGRVKQKAFLERIDPVALDLAGRLKDAFDPRAYPQQRPHSGGRHRAVDYRMSDDAEARQGQSRSASLHSGRQFHLARDRAGPAEARRPAADRAGAGDHLRGQPQRRARGDRPAALGRPHLVAAGARRLRRRRPATRPC